MVARQLQATTPDLHGDEDLILAVGRWLDDQSDTIGELHADRSQIRDIGPADDPARCSKTGIRPGHGRIGHAGADWLCDILCILRGQRRIAAVDTGRRGQLNERSRSGEYRAGGSVDLCGRKSFYVRFEQRQVCGGTGDDFVVVNRLDHIAGQTGGGARRGARHRVGQRTAHLGNLAGKFRVANPVRGQASHFMFDGQQGLLPGVGRRQRLNLGDLRRVQQVAVAGLSADEWRVVTVRQTVQAPVEDRDRQRIDGLAPASFTVVL